ncbi:MAG: hypothetical protein HYS81_00995 [Candidatus Aenigmatarchaeota archaeon]|nr:MAG: hypothetical protein HYS81_00995 [Candidatus Aenigmarchaeota archaeon]
MKAVYALLLLVLVAGCTGSAPQTGAVETQPAPETATITITAAGFAPNEVTIRQGGTVTWTNANTANHWVASAMHPLHDSYPGAAYYEPGTYGGTRSCSAEGVAKAGAFDSCKGIAPGESYAFTFIQTGTFFYHDHLNPTLFGSVVVE